MRQSMMTMAVLLVGGVATLAGPKQSEPPPLVPPATVRPEGMFSVSEEVVTPHTAWAKPYAQKPPAILFIVPRWTAREVVEVAERLTMKYAVVMTESQDAWSGVKDDAADLEWSAERPQDTTRRLTAALANPWNAIVVGNVSFAALPTNVVQMLDAKVRAGTGLFVTGNATNHVFANFVATAPIQALPATLTTTVPLGALPAFTNSAALPPFAAWRLGQGLVVSARYDVGSGHMAVSPDLTIPEMISLPVAYDYYQSLVIRALLFTAGRSPGAEFLTAVNVAPDPVAPAPSAITIQSQPGPGGHRLRVRIRDQDDRQWAVTAKPAAAVTLVPIRPGDLAVGRYFADVWLLDAQDRVLDWRTASFTVADPQGIASLTNDAAAVALGQEMNLRLTLKQPLAAAESLIVETRDFYQRVLSRTNLTGVGQTAFACRVPTTGCLSLIATAEARLERSGKLVAARSVSFPVARPTGTGPGWDDFSFMVWSFVYSAPADRVFQQLRAAGMDRLLTAAWSPVAEHIRQAALVAARYDCLAFPYAGWVGSIGNCQPAPIRQNMGEVARGLAPYSCDAYSMGDEDNLYWGKPVDFSEQPLNDPQLNADFQAYLKRQYPSLAALNTEWNTTFTNWAEVNGITCAEATNRHQEARWVDDRLYRETKFAGAFAAGQQGVQAVNPRNRTGFEGIFQTQSFRGYDWAKLGAAMTLYGNYWMTPAEYEFIASFKRPGSYWGFWNGCYPDVLNQRTQRWCAWRCLCHGMNSVWFWVPYWSASMGSPFGIYYPDLRENPVHKPFLESVGEIQGGLGKLILNADRTPAPIAIHYSQPSIHACTLDNGGFQAVGAGVETRMHSSWITFAWSLKEVGLQPRFVSTKEIEAGKLRKYRVLILPFSQAISTAEAAAIRAFVEAGGVVVADVRPGWRDEHGQLRATGALDDVFGVSWNRSHGSNTSHETHTPPKPADLALDLTLAGRHLAGVLPYAQPDPAVRLAQGQALARQGQTPIFIVNRLGKGTALLLNFAGNYSPGSYAETTVPPVRTTPRGDAYLDLALAIARLGGVEPSLTVTSGGERLRGIDLITWQRKTATYFGFTANDYCDFLWVRTMPAQMSLAAACQQPGFFYDMRGGKFLGEGRQFQVDLRDGSAAFVARLPYRVTGLEIRGPRRAHRGAKLRFTAAIRHTSGAVADHVLRVTVQANGQERPWYAANLLAPGGRAEYELPLALNDPPGDWVISVRDAATGITGRRTVRVE